MAKDDRLGHGPPLRNAFQPARINAVAANPHRRPLLLATAAVALATGVTSQKLSAAPATAPSEREARLAGRRDERVNREAADLFRTAETTYLVGDLTHAVELYQRALSLSPGGPLQIRCLSRLGDCAFDARRFDDAVRDYRRAASAAGRDAEAEEAAAAVRADFMVGQSYLSARQYTQAFGNFRRFIDRHPEHPLVNQAYQAIGDAHLAQGQYEQALRAYRMVGTVLARRPDSVRRIAPGDRLYLRVTDADVNIGDAPHGVTVTVRTTSGSSEEVELEPLGIHSPVFVGTLPTELGAPRRGGDLKAIFNDDVAADIRARLNEAESLDGRARQEVERLHAVERSSGEVDPAGRENARSAAAKRTDELARQSAALRRSALASVDQSFAGIEKLLALWAPEQSLEQVRRRAAVAGGDSAGATTRPGAGSAPAGAKAGDETAAGTLAEPDPDPRPTAADRAAGDEGAVGPAEPAEGGRRPRGLTQAEIDKVRLEAAAAPATPADVEQRLAALSLWARALRGQFQVLELSGADKIEVEYHDEVGPDGPNDPVKARKLATTEVASDAHMSLLTSDGREPIAQAILGSTIRLRVEDRDRDVSPGLDKITVTLSAVSAEDRARSSDAARPAATQPDTRPVAHGELPEPETRPSVAAVLPLAPPGVPSIVVTLVETGPHSGVFERDLALGADRVAAGGAALPLDATKRLRFAYADARALTRPDGTVLVETLDCSADRGGEVAAVKYRQTHLDLEAKLQRAVSAGEIGKIYLDLGLVSRGRGYLRAAQDDCAGVAAAAQASGDASLSEEALYRSWRIYFYAGLLDEAVASANTLTARYPDSKYADAAVLQIGQISVERGEAVAGTEKAEGRPPAMNPDLQRAVAQFEALVRKWPDSALAPEALFLEGRARIAAGQTGLESFERLAKRYPDSGFAPKGLIQAANYYVGVGDYSRAQEYLGRVVGDYPDSPQRGEVLLYRGACQFKLGQSADALRTLYQVVEEHPGTDLAGRAQHYIDLLNHKTGE